MTSETCSRTWATQMNWPGYWGNKASIPINPPGDYGNYFNNKNDNDIRLELHFAAPVVRIGQGNYNFILEITIPRSKATLRGRLNSCSRRRPTRSSLQFPTTQ